MKFSRISKKKKTIIIATILAVVFALVVVVPFGVAMHFYNQYFGIRYETKEPFSYTIDEFPDLKRERYEFKSNEDQTLVGYNYYVDKNAKGIIIIAHGFGGGGHNSYMDCANFFAKNGYYAFAYDVTGNDESEGDSIRGLPQGAIDLDYAISFVEAQDEFKDLPIMLFGHSWGGYSVTNVLNYHPEVKAVVSLAGFNKSSDLVRSQGNLLLGEIVGALMPYVDFYEYIKFGSYASSTSMDGFEKSGANIMIVHSIDDDVVQKKYGYDIYYEKYKDSPRFEFVSYETKGHTNLYYSDSTVSYIKEFYKNMDEHFSGYDEVTEKQKSAYTIENFDRSKWANSLDEALFTKILAFYNSSL